jgi:tetratricopeptide (TPR) repeat protein
MTGKNPMNNYSEICTYITENKLSDAFILLGNSLNMINNSELINRFEKQKEIYSLYMEYTLKGVTDPERINIYKRIQIALLEITESVRDAFFSIESRSKLASEKRILSEQIHKNKINIESEINVLLNKNVTDKEILINKLFFLIWLSDKIGENDVTALRKISRTKRLNSYEKSVVVSALTISLLRRFDIQKSELLFDFYDTDEEEVWNRALVGIVISFYVFNKRISLYDSLVNKLKHIKKDKGIEQFIEAIILQLIRTKETDKISKKLRDEIIPEMQKFRPKIEEKLNLDNIISDKLIEDLNPDWEEMFDEAPDLLGKMADFSKLQLEGSDVFMSAFAGFKNFPFFKQISNWFLPFYAENKDVKLIFSEFDKSFDADAFTKGLERSAFMCNSDKYSFCLNIQLMPKAQRGMMTELFKAEMNQMKEISDDDELLNKYVKDKHIFIRYIQDLYRFYKLHPFHNEFDDFFETPMDIHNTLLFSKIIDNQDILSKIAELYFKKEFFEEAVDAFSQLNLNGKEAKKNYEKIGYALQKNKNYEKALDFFQKAELFEEASLWLTKKIAFCYRKNRNYLKALDYYKAAELAEPENIHTQANIGYCYVSAGDFNNALKNYFKVEYYEPENTMAKRPIAWCSFILGKFDTAEKYYLKLIADKPSAFDYMNYAHVLYCKGEKMQAIDNYLKAIELKDLKTFIENINEDREYLIKHGIEDSDIEFLIDYVKLKCNY